MELYPVSLVITGASGSLGRRTAELLLDRVDPTEVVLVTRRTEALDDLAARGATVRFGDFDDPSSLRDAFAGASRVLVISTDAVGRRVPQHRNAIEAARDAGAAHVIYTSLPNPVPENPAGAAPDHAGTEEIARSSGLAWTFLRNALYAEYRLPEAQGAIAGGVLAHNLGSGRTAFVSREDCAAAAAAVLAGGAEHEGKAYDITGAEAFGATELAELYASLGGRDVEVVALDDDAYTAGLVEHGVPAEVAPLLTSFGRAIREGHLSQVSSAVQDLTGRAPLTLREVLQGALATA
jgi:NAD(P)H dehydrogenase (quinone)